MKTIQKCRIYLMILLVTGWLGVTAQTVLESEVPGDNFSLEGALELFKKSGSPEEFERKLNSPDSRVNNLDLNNDGYIDYIRVIDRTRGNVHAFIMQAVLSERESQDVAVIELEKLANGKAVLQITGDADVYGIETIIEPTEEVRINAGATTVRNVVNVWTWPSVQYVYGPHYNVWVSPWHWAYQPRWWRPWRPVAYYVYDPWWQPYRPYYTVCHTRRSYYAYEVYRPYRTTSVIVHHHYGRQIDSYRSRNESRYSERDRDMNGGRYRNEDGRRNNDSGRRYAESGRSYTNSETNSGNVRTRSDYGSRNPQSVQSDIKPRKQYRTNEEITPVERRYKDTQSDSFNKRTRSTNLNNPTNDSRPTPDRSYKPATQTYRSAPASSQPLPDVRRNSAPQQQRQPGPSINSGSRQTPASQPRRSEMTPGERSNASDAIRKQRGR